MAGVRMMCGHDSYKRVDVSLLEGMNLDNHVIKKACKDWRMWAVVLGKLMQWIWEIASISNTYNCIIFLHVFLFVYGRPCHCSDLPLYFF